MVSSASYNSKELLAGAFLLLLIGYLAYVALGPGRWRTIDRTGYLLYANFFSVSGLDVGAPVEIAGVPVGRVDSIALGADYQAQVALRINDHVTIDQIAVASIGREGILGSQSVGIVPGQSGIVLEPGQEIAETESPLSFQDMIGEFIVGDSVSGN
jgi:phospholipid/cholesterol/gamma-HCH transport system substrate-binding protein